MSAYRATSWEFLAFSVLAFAFVAPATALAQTDAESACRATIAKETNGYVRAALKTTVKCHGKRDRGKLPVSTDCNSIAQADPKNKLDGKRAKLVTRLADPNASCAGQTAVLDLFSRCPSPGADADDGDATDGIDTFTELAACMAALADGLVEQLSRETMGLPASALAKPAAKCHKAIGKGLGKLLKTIGKERGRCQKDRDSQNLGLTYGCSGADPKLKIAKTLLKLEAGIDKRCNIDENPAIPLKEELNQFGACADTLDQLKSCIASAAVDRIGSGMAAMAYELPSECGVGRIHRFNNARAGGQITDTSLDTGFSGTSHGVDVPDRSADAIRPACSPDCDDCDIALDPVVNTPLSYCRCASDPSIPCSTINGADDACGLANNGCFCNYGSPLAISSGGTPVCVVNRIVADYEGTADVGKGEWNDILRLSALVHLGIANSAPCPTCDGDVTQNDGGRDGTCNGGLENGDPCDTNGTHPTFGPTSFDCPPVTASNVSGNGLQLKLAYSNFPQSFPYELPCDDAGESCLCRVCSGDTNVGCSSNQDCVEAEAGVCTGGGGAGVHRNECDDGICTDEVCEGGPIDQFCDGALTADGRGYVTCVADLDCQAQALGACSVSEKRRCYNDPLDVSGTPGSLGAISGTVFCIPPTTSAAVNAQGGLPGPGRLVLDFDTDMRCQSDPSVAYQPPGGSSCPPGSGTTTTTLPTLACGDTFPACAGDCPNGEFCENTGLACACTAMTTTTTLPVACGSTLFPVCGGNCPLNSSCQGTDIGQPCFCFP